LFASKSFVCIGVPYFLGEKLSARTAVAMVRAANLAPSIGAEWIEVAPDFSAAPDPITAVNRALVAALHAHRNQFPLIFSGDCLNSIGAVKGLITEAGMGVVWFDAHGDFNTPATTQTGFLGGMPLAMLVGHGDLRLLDGVGLAPLREQDVILTDARDLDPAEGVLLRSSAVTHLPHVTDLLTAPLPAKPLYIHLDVDVVTPDDLPVKRYATQGGPSLDETIQAVQRLAREGRAAGLLFSLGNDDLADDDRPVQGILKLARAFTDAL